MHDFRTILFPSKFELNEGKELSLPFMTIKTTRQTRVMSTFQSEKA